MRKVFGIVGWKNSGKTTFMEKLVQDICLKRYSVSTIKHAHHSFDIDKDGKDSFRHRQAGAREVLVSSENRWALMSEVVNNRQPSLKQLISKMSPVDLILVEGFKLCDHKKLEINRYENSQPFLYETDTSICALVTDAEIQTLSLPCFGLNDIDDVANFILRNVGLV